MLPTQPGAVCRSLALPACTAADSLDARIDGCGRSSLAPGQQLQQPRKPNEFSHSGGGASDGDALRRVE
eukprot:CAMPEP_0195069460 /NCGR_PEP_ID=MMETSP0448-20130528/13763_1 /TAXON_ID=66468 /ORGANISM="Heterocapsa triquestra, Strain CCMP 448" /LENGTH=68 /DNA_ID=CAMNT_0040101067 /DNA_START=1 /DNA_END=204 /DNA_ORIENTATION=+